MRIVTSFPRKVAVHEHVWITLADGCRLAARIWLPDDAAERPVPAILEYLPYRKRDGTVVRDALTCPWFAGHGCAYVRVDLRGNGDSDGLMEDEYTKQEQDDALEVIAWIAAQSWSTGKVAMMGISWGGFNGLQIAARRPPALGAVVTLCSTDDRYADDIHYKGGCLLNENLGWSSTMLAYSSRPPDPELVGESWRETWLARLRAEPHLAAIWLDHPHRDAYWRHGSVCEDWDAIQVPVLAIGGWADAYHNAVPRLLTGLKGRCWGIMGPWIHKYPHFATPEPRIGFLEEAARFLDRWLNGVANGAEHDPAYRAYLMDGAPPRTNYDVRPGRWVAEQDWPSPSIAPEPWHLGERGLTREAQPAATRSVCSPQTVGIAGGEYCPIWKGPDLPGDQRIDDGGSLCFDGPILDAPLDILGAPVLDVSFTADRPQANLAVRLCDVNPDGSSTRASWGVFNLCHHAGHAEPEPLVPGRRYRMRLVLDDTGYRFPAGHRLRVAVSTAYWPMIWPSPETATVMLDLAECRLLLPVRPMVEGEVEPVFPPAEAAEPLAERVLEPGGNRRIAAIDQATGVWTLEIEDRFGTTEIPPSGIVAGGAGREWYAIHPDDPLSASMRTHWTETLSRGAWSIRTETFAQMRSDATHFHLTARIEAYEGDALIFARDFATSHPRRCV